MRRAQGVILRLGLCTPKRSRSVAPHSTQLTGGSKNRFGAVFLRRVRLYFQRHQKHLGAICKSFQEIRNLIDGSPLATGKVLDVLTSLPPVGCSRIWCFRASGFEEIRFQFRKPASRSCPKPFGEGCSLSTCSAMLSLSRQKASYSSLRLAHVDDALLTCGHQQ